MHECRARRQSRRRRRRSSSSSGSGSCNSGNSSSGGADTDPNSGSSADDEAEYWWACDACNTSTARREQQQSHMQDPVHCPDADIVPALVEWRQQLLLLLALPPGGATQLAVLRCGVRYAHRMYGYLHALSAADKNRPPLLAGPLIDWDEAWEESADPVQLATAFQSLTTYMRTHNPIVNKYQTMWEVDDAADADSQVSAHPE